MLKQVRVTPLLKNMSLFFHCICSVKQIPLHVSKAWYGLLNLTHALLLSRPPHSMSLGFSPFLKSTLLFLTIGMLNVSLLFLHQVLVLISPFQGGPSSLS